VATDVVIVGAGPVGLFQVFELGLLEIRVHVVDALGQPGGQCIELYPDKPIYDIPGLPRCTGRELVARLLEQARPFEPVFHLGQQVSALQRQDDGRFLVQASGGTRLLARAVVIAAGVGAFTPRMPKVEGLERFEGTQLLHRVGDPALLAGRHVLVLGGEDAALEALRAAGRIGFVAGQPVGFAETAGRLSALHIACGDGAEHTVPADLLLVCLGLSPRLGPVAGWGLAMDRRQLAVNTETFETSEPGIYAVGDINTYPGKKKLIVCGFHEATLAAYGVGARLYPERQGPLQYTTASPRLHRLLGVDTPAAG
jgi:thioredoxin reductase (NADPH)